MCFTKLKRELTEGRTRELRKMLAPVEGPEYLRAALSRFRK